MLHLPYDNHRDQSTVQVPRLKFVNLAIRFCCERTMPDRKLIHFDNSPSYGQQIAVFHLFGQYVTCGAYCTTVGRDQAHWLGVLSKPKADDSGDLNRS